MQCDRGHSPEYGKILVCVILFVAAFALGANVQKAVRSASGQSAPNEPTLIEVYGMKPWNYDNLMIIPLAYYDITARILAHKEYDTTKWLFDSGRWLPFDFGLGWGPLSDPAIYKKACYLLHCDEKGRYLTQEYHDPAIFRLLSSDEICSYISNNHLIASNSEIRKKLAAFNDDDTIRLKGYLVEVIGSDAHGRRYSVSSSLSVQLVSKGVYKCRVMWVDDAIKVQESDKK